MKRRTEGAPARAEAGKDGLSAQPSRDRSRAIPAPMSIVDAMESPDLFAPWFPGGTWRAWKAILRAAFALPMSPEERMTFSELAGGRAPPLKRVKELVVVAGRRSGKDSTASAVATWIAGIEQGHLGLLRPGELASVMLLACDREQSRIIRNYVASYFQTVPILAEMVIRETKTGLELNNGVEIVIATNDFRAVRGRSVLCAVMDEAAFYADETSVSPDIETDRALEPGLATLPCSLKIIISSPHKKAGLLFEKFRTCYGKDDDRTLVIQAPTTALNPTIDVSIIERAMADDPAAAKAEWFAGFRDDVSSAFALDLIELVVDRGVTVRPPREGLDYKGYVDVASGSGRDSFAAAIAHLEGDEVVLDALFEQRPPFNPQNITTDACALFKQYRISTCIGDKYAAGYNVEAFARCGVTYLYCERDTSQNYLETLPLFTSGRVRLLDNQRLVGQFVGLERRTSRTGRDRVDHGVGDRHDDLSAACAGALMLAGDGRGALIKQSDLLKDGAALPLPRGVGIVTAVFATDKLGNAAIVYAAHNRPGRVPPMLILDFDHGPLRASVFTSIASRMQELVEACELPLGVVFVPKEMKLHAEAQGLPCELIPPDFEAESRLISAAQHVAQNSVKIAEPAFEKSKTSPFGGALDFRAAEGVDNALRAAAVLSIALGLDSTGGRIAA